MTVSRRFDASVSAVLTDKTAFRYCEHVQFPNCVSTTVFSRREFNSHADVDATKPDNCGVNWER